MLTFFLMAEKKKKKKKKTFVFRNKNEDRIVRDPQNINNNLNQGLHINNSYTYHCGFEKNYHNDFFNQG